MFRKIAITALSVAVIATSGLAATTTTADAKNGKKGAFAAGAVIGLATGAIVAGAHRDRYYDRGYYAPRHRNCWDKPVRRWDPYYREYVVVGYRTVCR
ncbi:tyrosyl-tRNA synthetase [Breoghania sp.]|uniref:tyrosyl-tRNA synthetase n=1 Tax=Breoghania sp. TaxID=2065378 RepID=UPI002AA791FF|nr:tyrosyl-tRNA synthetase [Breoghania sp.]